MLKVTGVCWSLSQQSVGEGSVTLWMTWLGLLHKFEFENLKNVSIQTDKKTSIIIQRVCWHLQQNIS